MSNPFGVSFDSDRASGQPTALRGAKRTANEISRALARSLACPKGQLFDERDCALLEWCAVDCRALVRLSADLCMTSACPLNTPGRSSAIRSQVNGVRASAWVGGRSP